MTLFRFPILADVEHKSEMSFWVSLDARVTVFFFNPCLAQCDKTTYARNLRIWFVPGKPFKPILMFVAKAMSLI
jgi:hypothetical protein